MFGRKILVPIVIIVAVVLLFLGFDKLCSGFALKSERLRVKRNACVIECYKVGLSYIGFRDDKCLCSKLIDIPDSNGEK